MLAKSGRISCPFVLSIRYVKPAGIELPSSFIAGPKEARNPNLDSDQRISYYACVPCL